MRVLGGRRPRLSSLDCKLCGVEGEDIRDGTDTLPRLRPGRRCERWIGVGTEIANDSCVVDPLPEDGGASRTEGLDILAN